MPSTVDDVRRKVDACAQLRQDVEWKMGGVREQFIAAMTQLSWSPPYDKLNNSVTRMRGLLEFRERFKKREYPTLRLESPLLSMKLPRHEVQYGDEYSSPEEEPIVVPIAIDALLQAEAYRAATLVFRYVRPKPRDLEGDPFHNKTVEDIIRLAEDLVLREHDIMVQAYAPFADAEYALRFEHQRKP